MIITVANQKGGVAKTTTAVSVAHGLAIRTGQPTLLLDLDQQGHDATALGMMAESCLFDFLVADAPLANCVRQTGRENLLLLPGNARTKHVDLIYRNEIDGFAKLCQRLRSLPYAFVVIDTPAEGLLQEAAIHVADWIDIPARCEALSIAGVHDTLALTQRLNPALRILVPPTMYDKRLNEHGYNLGILRQLDGDCTDAIPARVAVAEAQARGKTIWEHGDAGLQDVRSAYDALLDHLALPVRPNAHGEATWMDVDQAVLP